MNNPIRQDFEQRLITTLGDAYAQRILVGMATSPVAAYWLNPLIDLAFDRLGKPLDHLSDVWVVGASEREHLTHHPAANAGRIYPLNPSSRLPVLALGAQPDEEILDLASAPGGKAIMLAAAMNNTGRLAVVEPVSARFHRLKANLARCGVTNAAFYQHDGRAVGSKVPERFDRVLLDAPCSTEARIRWEDESTYRHWKPRKVTEAAKKQRGLLRSAYRALKPGGVLVYSTCSYALEENEAVVARLLRREPSAWVEPIRDETWMRDVPLMPALALGKDPRIDAQLSGCVRVLPDAAWDGFFFCRLRKPALTSEVP